ncbi:hypothetical protein BH23PLA1_BH23PLA1_34390 [soil metagenome]
MHIHDAMLSPTVAAATGVVAFGGFAYCLKRLEDRLKDRTTVLMGIMSAFVFAAQMVNFPLPGLPASGHLIGAVLAVVLLGPWAGAVVMGAVLIVQCLLFADGGITVLGANFVNLGLIAAVGGFAIYAPIRRAIGGRSGVLIGAMAAAWFSVILSSAAFAVELAASGRGPGFLNVLGWMTLVHAVIGLGEAIITGLVLRFLLLTRPDLIFEPDKDEEPRRWRQIALAGLGISLAVAAFLAPLASPQDDGLEFVGARLGFMAEESPSVIEGPMPDYEMPGLPGVGLPTAAAGLVGTLVVFVVGLVLARAFARREGAPLKGSPQGIEAHAT